ncbi:MAG: hypothetical protein ACJASQ_003149 [Crocinitomicaceae bacterium]|jgi:hypothetical protein
MIKIVSSLFFVLLQLSLYAQIPTDSLLLHMPFNGNANDETGNGNNGFVNGASLTADRFGNPNAAYLFDGIDDRIDITNVTLVPDNSVSISFWFAPATSWDSSTDHQIFFQSDLSGDTDGEFIIAINRTNCYSVPHTNDGKINFELQGDLVNGNSAGCPGYGLTRVSSTTDAWSAGVWHMITAVVDNGQIKVYVDGVFENTQLCTSSLFISGQGITLGRYDAPQHLSPLNGAMDDIRIYKKVLTNSEINSLFNESLGIVSMSNDATIKVYPNPASDYLFIEIDNNTGHHIRMINTLGQVIHESDFIDNKTSVDLSQLSGKGVYFIEISDSLGKLIDVEKIILE